MKVAVTVWEDRVSPVFDSARNLLIAEIRKSRVVNTRYQQFDPVMVSQLARMLRENEVAVIICGAVSEGPATLLEAAGFELISFIAGDVDRVLDNFIKKNPVWTELIMPGCCRKSCCQRSMQKRFEIEDIVTEERLKGKLEDDKCLG